MPDTAAASTVLFEVRDQVAHITLNRPEAANTVNVALARDLLQAARRCEADASIRTVVITGAGATFCGGGDLKSFAAEDERVPEYVGQVLDALHTAISCLAHLEAPVIAAVNGAAAGAGMSLMCACDLAIAAASARFTMAYTRVGLSPDGSSSFYLARLVGLRRALDLTLTNRLLSAQEALEWGLVTRVVPDAALREETERLATQLATGATRALGAAKRLLRDGWTETLETQLAHESLSIQAMAHTADAREGITAFVDRRPPNFTGR